MEGIESMYHKFKKIFSEFMKLKCRYIAVIQYILTFKSCNRNIVMEKGCTL
jgi:hypothetical protein